VTNRESSGLFAEVILCVTRQHVKQYLQRRKSLSSRVCIGNQSYLYITSVKSPGPSLVCLSLVDHDNAYLDSCSAASPLYFVNEGVNFRFDIPK
jgi:hypothetical protein